MIERRAMKFTESVSMFMLRAATVGALVVLADIRFTFDLGGQVIAIGSGFSPDLKGGIITIMLIGGWTAVKEYWLGSSAGSAERAQTIDAIVTGAPAAQAVQVAAIAAAIKAPAPPVAPVPVPVPISIPTAPVPVPNLPPRDA